MTQLFMVSTLYQCVSLATAIDAGAVGTPDEERILVLTNSALIPEVTDAFQDSPGFAEVASRFDRMVDLSALLWPRRPSQFNPRGDELDLWEKLLRTQWNLGKEPVHFFVESIQVNPALALCRIFAHATVSVHSDGLMSYGPTRNPLPREIAQRLDALLYVDLVPGLVPQLLREHGPRLVPISATALRNGMEALHSALPVGELPPTTDGGTALILGQYLLDLGIMTSDDEVDLHRSMLQRAADAGIMRCVFKPHPSAGPGSVESVRTAAAELGLELNVLSTGSPAEVVMQRLEPQLVISCFSTALMTARYLFNIESAAVGTDLLLERLTPYQNSNRIPVTIVDAILEREARTPAELQMLVDAVSYCMQSELLPMVREEAIAFLAVAEGTADMRYFKRRRLSSLALPGALPPSIRTSVRALPPARAIRRLRRAGTRRLRRVGSHVLRRTRAALGA